MLHEHYAILAIECLMFHNLCVFCEHWICYFVNIEFARCFVSIVLLQGFRVWC
jgi:hypothetical protein